VRDSGGEGDGEEAYEGGDAGEGLHLAAKLNLFG
jgi:hypothetical protein